MRKEARQEFTLVAKPLLMFVHVGPEHWDVARESPVVADTLLGVIACALCILGAT